MDEAVAGHATRIEVEMLADGSVLVRDNGRGIPVDPHPKFPGKSALEVILCTLHAGGKFSNKAYSTSGGLNGGVGSSVVNALSDSMIVQVARNKELYEQRFSRGTPLGPVEKLGAAPNRRGTTITFHPRSGNLRRAKTQTCAAVQADAIEGLSVLRRRNSLEIRNRRWRNAHRGHLPFPPTAWPISSTSR